MPEPEATEPTVDELLKKCSDSMNRMSEVFIEFSIAYVALHDHLEAQKHPTLFDDKDKT